MSTPNELSGLLFNIIYNYPRARVRLYFSIQLYDELGLPHTCTKVLLLVGNSDFLCYAYGDISYILEQALTFDLLNVGYLDYRFIDQEVSSFNKVLGCSYGLGNRK